jgi:hypothetical protein
VESILHNDCIIIIQKVEFKSSLASKSTDGTGDTQALSAAAASCLFH